MDKLLPSRVALGFLPEAILIAAALALLGLALLRPRARRAALGLALTGALGALVAVGLVNRLQLPAGGPGFVVDRFALFFQGLFALIALLVVLQASHYAQRFGAHAAEFFALLLLASTGSMLMAAAAEMAALFVALELLSVSLYVLAAFLKRDPESSEAGIKYLVVGIASSGVLLYGLALLYGLTGHTDLAGVAAAIRSGGRASPALLLALAFVLAGLAIKLGVVPFHMWVPDVYDGAPTPVGAFISVGAEAAAFALFLRVMLTGLGPVQADWAPVLAVLAAATMTLANFAALAQTDLKRLLGYSSIAQGGYVLMAALEPAGTGLAALLFFLLTYAFTNLAVFGAVIAFHDAAGSDTLAAHAGMARRAPFLGAVLALGFASLVGIPPLIGYFGKFFVFLSAVRAGYTWLALVAVLNTVVSAVYYLRVLKVVYVDDAPSFEPARVDRPMRLSLVVCSAGVVGLGFLAGPALDLAGAASLTVR